MCLREGRLRLERERKPLAGEREKAREVSSIKKKESNENFEKKELRVSEGKKLKYNHVRTNWRKGGGEGKMKARKSGRES